MDFTIGYILFIIVLGVFSLPKLYIVLNRDSKLLISTSELKHTKTIEEVDTVFKYTEVNFIDVYTNNNVKICFNKSYMELFREFEPIEIIINVDSLYKCVEFKLLKKDNSFEVINLTLDWLELYKDVKIIR